jgi:error-prone DNA polymerase
LLTRAHLRSEKGRAAVRWAELPESAGGLVALTGDREGPLPVALATEAEPAPVLKRLVAIFGPQNVYVEIQRHRIRGEERGVRALIEMARQFQLPLLATNGVQYAAAAGRPVLDAFTCIRQHTHLDAAGRLLAPNGERYFRTRHKCELRGCLEAVSTVRLAGGSISRWKTRLQFPGTVPARTMDSFCGERTFAGARE